MDLLPPDGKFLEDIEDDINQPRVAAEEFGKRFPWDFDICAWYRPIHYHRRDFGIFIKRSCMQHYARGIARVLDPSEINVPTASAARQCLVAAGFVFLLHEFYHHKVESFAIRLHLCSGSHQTDIPYLRYHERVYRPLLARNSDHLIEEALANAYAYRRLTQDPYTKILPLPILLAARASLKAGFQYQPGGYNRAGEFLTQSAFTRGEYQLQQQVFEGTAQPSSPEGLWRSAPEMLQSVFLVRDVPVTLVPF